MVAKSKASANSRGRSANRSAFREEFYADRKPDKGDANANRLAAQARVRRRRRKVSVYVPVFGLFFLLCIIAVAGSSAMIWLRKLGQLFDVEWAGDG